MNQLSLNPIDRNVIDPAVRGPAASNVRHLAAARASLRAASRPLVRQWRRDPAIGALRCVWTVVQGTREPASPVPLRRAS